MKRCNVFFLIVVLYCAAFSNELALNDSHQPLKTASRSAFINLGLGKSPSVYGQDELSAGIQFYAMRSKLAFSLRALGNMEYAFKAGPSPIESISDVSVLCGYQLYQARNISILPLVGCGRVTKIKRGELIENFLADAEHEKMTENRFGISGGINLQLHSNNLSFSLYPFCNLNPLQNYYGVLICLGFGKF